MIRKIFSVYDLKSGCYNGLILGRQLGEITRELTSLVNEKNSKHVYSTNSSDFVLYEIGTFDDQIGMVKSEIKKIYNLIELYTEKKEKGLFDEE